MKRKREPDASSGGYAGYSPSREGERVPVLDASEVSGERFYGEYVLKRRPVVFDGHLAEENWRIPEAWSLDYLKRNVGNARASVEYRETLEHGFGKGNRVEMKFRDFLEELERGNERLYCTSQDTKDGKLFTSPLAELHGLGDFPVRPKLASGLIPANLSLWMGSSSSPSSSGLHHDYHDNLYILIEGTKDFTLYSPAHARAMRTHGAIERVHPNGLISYRGHETHADGTTDFQRKSAEAKARVAEAERVLHSLEAAPESTPAAIERAEAALDEALDADLSFAADEASGEEDGSGGGGGSEEGGGEGPPRNFSRLGEGDEEGVKAKCMAMQVTLSAGQMLYLPCGWFHNVKSRSGAGPQEAPYHLAFNYWFYPPDNIDGSGGGDSGRPYKHGARQILWDLVQKHNLC